MVERTLDAFFFEVRSNGADDSEPRFVRLRESFWICQRLYGTTTRLVVVGFKDELRLETQNMEDSSARTNYLQMEWVTCYPNCKQSSVRIYFFGASLSLSTSSLATV